MRVLGYFFLILLAFSQSTFATQDVDVVPIPLAPAHATVDVPEGLESHHSLAVDCALAIEGSPDCASPVLPEKRPGKWYYSSIKEMPMGIGVNGVFLRQNVSIDNISIGLSSFNDGQLYNIDSLVTLPSVQPHVWGTSARADIWVLPFLNLFAVGGHNWIRTPMTISLFPNGGLTIPPRDICIPLPGGEQCKHIDGAHIDTFNFDTTVYPQSNAFGVGTVLALPIKNWAWVSLDATFLTSFRDISDPTRMLNSTLRVGKNFNSLILNRQRTAFWVGVNMVNLLGDTTENGSVPLAGLIDDLNLIPQDTKDQINGALDNLVAGAQPDMVPCRPLNQGGPPCGSNPADTLVPNPGCGTFKFCETQAQKVTELRNDFADRSSNLYRSDILYSVDKQLIGQFEGYIGMEQQLYDVAVRFETSMNINRMQFLLSLQYRFN